MTYDVVLLVEQALTPADAAQVRSLHEEIDAEGEGPVIYHVLLPMEDAAARIEASLGSLSGGGMVGSPSLLLDSVDFDEIRQQSLAEATAALNASLIRHRRRSVHLRGADTPAHIPAHAAVHADTHVRAGARLSTPRRPARSPCERRPRPRA